MKIRELELRNFRGIKYLKLDFNEKSTVLFGINGVGKSSVLRSVDLLYANIIGKLLNRSRKLAELSEEDIFYGMSKASIKAIFRFPSGEEFEYFRYISKLSGKRQSASLNKLISYFEEQYITKKYEDSEGNLIIPEDKKNMPIFVNYGVNRLVVDIPLETTKQTEYMKLSAFDKAIESRIDFNALFEWFRMREDLENQEKVRLNIQHEDRDLKAVRTVMLAMLDGFEHIHVERQPLRMLIEKEGITLSLNQLSDGEKCTLALFGDLARRMAIANPVLEDPLKGSGVVLIDELELHMHTQWQRKVLGALQKTFPNIQFIITTHSPQILGEVNQVYQIISLKKQEGRVELCSYQSLYGWDSNAILEEAMDTDSLTEEVKGLIRQMFDALKNKEYESAERSADRIDEITRGRNTSTAKVRVLIHRGRRNDRDQKE